MSKLRVLHLEDNETDAFFIQQALEDGGFDVEIVVASGREEYLAELGKGNLDLILSDHGLPGFSGNAALKIAREKHPQTPFIFVSGFRTEKEIAEGLEAGAFDYVSKDHPGQLISAIRRAVG